MRGIASKLVRILLLIVAAAASLSASSSLAQEFAAASVPAAPLVELRPFRTWLSTHAERNAEIDTPIQTDRPSFTAAPTVVPKGWAQLESGYQFTHNQRATRVSNQYAAPQLNLRLGLFERLESRTLWAGVETTAERDLATNNRDVVSTSSNLETGFKFQTTYEYGLIPTSALITTIYLPTGSGAAAEDHVTPTVDYIYTWSLTEHLSFTGSTGAIFASANGESDEFFQSLVLGGDWSDKWSTYWEWYVTGSERYYRDTRGQNFDGGVLWRPWKNVQFDWRAGFGLNKSANNFFTGVGFSARY